ncbi:FtsH protease activity modulator HflK [Comamonas sp. NLF-1-9]|uniref:FtsH protease activity modulator HflK n=1 Tax=Comamonas sp. NLF-1-9 TaxID=2853163 RepID=UPI001C4768AA|nr:FtsH protease activity modulator HflK [Comamonas sp. NLF-1-9]QXL85528.1 FtsH protease activity modulator HflK [Comamonas sp. NLF-1-9]
MDLRKRVARRLAAALGARPVYNLNDPRWGRSDEDAGEEPRPPQPDRTPEGAQPPRPARPSQGSGANPPDLDELWRDLQNKLGGLFGGAGRSGRRGGSAPPGGGGFQPDMRNAGKSVAVLAVIALLVWLSTGFFIVQEGQQAVITQFGKYKSTVGAGFNWRLPYPIQRHELVFVTQIRSVDIGRDSIIKATGLRDSAMLTEDENIVEIKFAVQYRLNDARAWLFESRNPADAVVQAAESAVREVVGRMKMDSALADERDQIAPRVRTLMQTILDRYKVGVEVVGINLQQGGVRPPEQVQAAFDDVLKAGQERERTKNEAQAYANDVVPRASGAASRLQEEAAGYKARVVAQAEGDAQRFDSVVTEYQKAPQVTRERMYLDAMQQVLSGVTKVIVESREGSNLLYLPLDKLMGADAALAPPAQGAAAASSQAHGAAPAAPASTSSTTPAGDARSRDVARSREREPR